MPTITQRRWAAAKPQIQPKTFGANPPAAPSGGVPTADDYMTKVVKYVPLEVLGAYLFLSTQLCKTRLA